MISLFPMWDSFSIVLLKHRTTGNIFLADLCYILILSWGCWFVILLESRWIMGSKEVNWFIFIWKVGSSSYDRSDFFFVCTLPMGWVGSTNKRLFIFAASLLFMNNAIAVRILWIRDFIVYILFLGELRFQRWTMLVSHNNNLNGKHCQITCLNIFRLFPKLIIRKHTLKYHNR